MTIKTPRNFNGFTTEECAAIRYTARKNLAKRKTNLALGKATH